MKGELIILLVLASLTLSSHLPKLEVDYGLSKNQADVFLKIMVNQELTRTKCAMGIKTLFDAIFDLQSETDTLCEKIAEALSILKTAIDLTLDAGVFAMGKSCSEAVEVARSAAHASLDDAFARSATALRLARFGNYSKHQAAIAMHHAVVKQDYKNMIKIDYDLIETCLNTNNSDTLAVIESARNKSLIDVIHIPNTIFNAIIVYQSKVPVGCGDVDLASSIEDLKTKALASMKTYVEYKFPTLRTVYINARLHQCGIVFGVALSQYSEAVSFIEYVDGNDGIFSIATSYLRRMDLGLYDDGNDAFSATNVSFARVAAVYDVGDDIILDFILFIHPDSCSKIAKAREYLHIVKIEGNIACVNAFDIAVALGKNCSETLNAIETLRNSTISGAPEYTQQIFDLIRNNRTFNRKIEGKLKTLQKITLDGAVKTNHKFFDAAVILANARCKGIVSKKDYSVLQVLGDEANTEVAGFTQGIAAAGLSIYRVMNAKRVYFSVHCWNATSDRI